MRFTATPVEPRRLERVEHASGDRFGGAECAVGGRVVKQGANRDAIAGGAQGNAVGADLSEV
jgi:hypothetical protein